ncbi:MAG: hypothetical protein LC793_17250 [Thermomicrobia bacterium]|nr:hypothetical protein [Thermomicrobia bacterium]MCA1725791.1 hypothetical protein [Thermomicrobia bacterium]
MYFEIYDTETRNLLIDTKKLAESLAVVRATVGKHEPAANMTWALVEDDEADPGSGRPIATGEAPARPAAKSRAVVAQSHD